MVKAVLTLVLMALFCPVWVLAQASGTASGHYAKDGARIEFSHVVALGLDDAEGLLEPNVRMRIVLSDREVPVDTLLGIAFVPVEEMAKRGEVRGVMLEFDPRDRTTMTVMVLDRPAEPGQSLLNETLSDSEGLWRKLVSDPARISGQYARENDQELAFSFDAPVDTDPVVSTVTGAAVQDSLFLKLLRLRVQALAKGDIATLTRISSRAEAATYAAQPPPNTPDFKAMVAEQAKSLDHALKIVVRGKTAVVLLPEKSWMSFVKEDGDWKLAD